MRIGDREWVIGDRLKAEELATKGTRGHNGRLEWKVESGKVNRGRGGNG